MNNHDKGREIWVLIQHDFMSDDYRILADHKGDQKSAEVYFQEVLTCNPSWTLSPVFVSKLQLAKLTRKVENVEIVDFKIGDPVI